LCWGFRFVCLDDGDEDEGEKEEWCFTEVRLKGGDEGG
jgi:hypothetical protein